MHKLNDLSIAIIGAGKIAHSLAPAMAEFGCSVKVVISKSINSAKVLSQKCGSETYSDNFSDLNDSVQLVFLTVPDSQITAVAKEIAGLSIDFSKMTFVHLSGSKNIYELSPLFDKGAGAASMHLMNTFPSKERVTLRSTYAAIETNNEQTGNVISALAEGVGLIPFPVSSEYKAFYHLIGVFSSNFLVADFFNAEQCRSNLNESVPEVKELSTGIARNTIDNIKSKGITESISGPIERGDVDTIKNHLVILKNDKLTLLNYLASGLTLLQAVEDKSNAPKAHIGEIKNILINELKKCTKQF